MRSRATPADPSLVPAARPCLRFPVAWVRRLVFGAALAVSAVSPLRAEGLDLHWLWDDRCAQCHGHSAEFARRLSWRDGDLVLAHPVGDPLRFLRHHYPPEAETEPIYRMLQAEAATPPRFREACAGCHDSAAVLARESIVFRGSRPVVRRTGQPLGEALAGHRGIDAEAQVFFEALLTRVAREVHRPPAD